MDALSQLTKIYEKSAYALSSNMLFFLVKLFKRNLMIVKSYIWELSFGTE